MLCFFVSVGHGILELNILKARDLVAMDSNGEDGTQLLYYYSKTFI